MHVRADLTAARETSQNAHRINPHSLTFADVGRVSKSVGLALSDQSILEIIDFSVKTDHMRSNQSIRAQVMDFFEKIDILHKKGLVCLSECK